jgi:hypothetical protein
MSEDHPADERPADARSAEVPGGRSPEAVAARMAERYPPPPRLRRAAILAGVVVTLLAIGAVAATIIAAPQVVGRVTAYDPLGATSTSVTVEVTKPADRGADCTVAVQSIDGRVTGTAQVVVPPGSAVASVTVAVATLQPGVYATVADCRLT